MQQVVLCQHLLVRGLCRAAGLGTAGHRPVHRSSQPPHPRLPRASSKPSQLQIQTAQAAESRWQKDTHSLEPTKAGELGCRAGHLTGRRHHHIDARPTGPAQLSHPPAHGRPVKSPTTGAPTLGM